MYDGFWGLMIPFIGTALGAGCVLFVKKELNPGIQKALLGFAAGVMVAASVWSLLIPAMDMSERLGKWAFAPAAIGFMIGILFLLFLDHIIPHLHIGSDKSEGPKTSLGKSAMLVLAVTIHNIPEGISSGAVFAGILMGNAEVTMMGAFALSIGIAIQNFPEGFIVSLPIKNEGGSRKKAFYYWSYVWNCRAYSRRNYRASSVLCHSSPSVSSCIRGRSHDLRSRGRTGAGISRRRAQ